MHNVGIICVHGADSGRGVAWSTVLDGASLLERTVAELLKVPYLHECFVVTDDPQLSGKESVFGARVRKADSAFFRHGVPLMGKEHFLSAQAMGHLQACRAMGDVLLLADWRTPLMTSVTLERLYHKLLEDRIAARTVATVPIDPNLFIQIAAHKFFPVWADIGADRQAVPQLYRRLQAGAVWPERLLRHAPESKGLPVPPAEGIAVVDDESLELAAFCLASRRKAE